MINFILMGIFKIQILKKYLFCYFYHAFFVPRKSVRIALQFEKIISVAIEEEIQMILKLLDFLQYSNYVLFMP